MKRDKLAGIFTERDYARKVILKGRASKETKIEEIMTEDLITVNPDTSIEACMRLMTNKHIRHLPVVEDNKLVGIISIGDVVKHHVNEIETEHRALRDYIATA